MDLRDAALIDSAASRRLLLSAFPTPAEADLVEQLRASGDMLVELVATTDDAVQGMIGFSRLIAEDRPFRLACLAPLAVAPAMQGKGLGGRLTLAGIGRCRQAGLDGIVVLGDPAYYGRHGFSAEAAAPLRCPWSGPNLLALALRPGGLPQATTSLRFAAAFDAFA